MARFRNFDRVTDDELPPELAALAERMIRAEPRTRDEQLALASLTARLERIIQLLVARGVLGKQDERLIAMLGASRKPFVQLSVVRDKHAVVSPDIDCAANLPLCKGRCCSFTVPLDRDEVVEGELRWNLDDPYMLARAPDGYCTHLEPGGACECYGNRPAMCRAYDCRADERVWLDYDQRLPAPMPAWVKSRF